MRQGFPSARKGQCIGLLGGSFDPPHAGHVHLTEQALKGFGLDRVWWLVTPGNPLKAHGPAPMARRIAACRALIRSPQVVVTGIEADLGTRFSAATIEALIAHYPGVRFTWLMGADNLAGIHRWERWPAIFAQVPVGIIARPGDPLSSRLTRAARLFRRARLRGDQAQLLGRSVPPAWCYLPGPLVDLSSSRIRAKGGWRK
ncbi:MAG: nicotinate-nucleotide adenylyltransferase [Qingshengfaniella sp.]